MVMFGIYGYPAHQMVGGRLRVAAGEIEQGQFLLTVTSDIHRFENVEC